MTNIFLAWERQTVASVKSVKVNRIIVDQKIWIEIEIGVSYYPCDGFQSIWFELGLYEVSSFLSEEKKETSP